MPSSSSVALTLGPWRIVSVEVIAPDPFVLGVGGTIQLLVNVTVLRWVDDGDFAFEGEYVIGPVEAGTTYQSANPAIATVNSTGLITGIAQGNTTVTAKAGGITDSIAVTINNSATVASVDLTPTATTLQLGQSQLVTAAPRNAQGQQLLNRTLTWSEANATIADVGADSGTDPHTATIASIGVGSTTVKATCEGIDSPTCAVTVTATTGDYANEPAGFTIKVDSNMSSLSGWGNLVCPPACWSTVALATDASAPKSPSTVIRHTYPAGASSGNFPYRYFSFGGDFSEVYMCAWWKLSDPWDYHASTVNKMFFFDTNAGTSGQQNEVVFSLHGYSEAQARMEGAEQFAEGGSPYKPCNVNSSPWPLGQYNKLEVLMRKSTGGASNGEMHWWVNGLKQGQYTNVQYHDTIDGKFKGILWQHYWGGQQDTKTQTDFIWDDHLYASVKA